MPFLLDFFFFFFLLFFFLKAFFYYSQYLAFFKMTNKKKMKLEDELEIMTNNLQWNIMRGKLGQYMFSSHWVWVL